MYYLCVCIFVSLKTLKAVHVFIRVHAIMYSMSHDSHVTLLLRTKSGLSASVTTAVVKADKRK